MESSDFLHGLIRSLDEKEHKYVLSFARGGRSRATKKEQLYTNLRKQTDYNAQLLRPKYKQFDVLRFQVKQMVLQALRLYHEEMNADQRIELHLSNERILYRKGFYEASQKELEKAHALAVQYQRLAKLLEILQVQVFRVQEHQTKNLVPRVGGIVLRMEEIGDIYREQLVAFQKYQELFAAYRTEGKFPEGDRSPVDSEKFPITFFRDFYLHSAEGLKAHLEGDLEAAIRQTEAMVQLFDQTLDLREEMQVKYKMLLSNLGVLLIGAHRYDEVREAIQKIKALEDRDFNEEAEAWQNLIHLELLLMVNEKRFEGQSNLIRRVEEGLATYGHKVNAARKLAIWYNLLVLYLINENFQAARRMVDLIVQHKRFKVRKEIQYTTRLLELIIYFELEVWDSTDHHALKRYFERKDQQTEFKASVLKHIQKASSVPLIDRKRVFQSLERVLIEIAGNNEAPDNLGLALVAAWTRSKLGQGSLKDCLQTAKA